MLRGRALGLSCQIRRPELLDAQRRRQLPPRRQRCGDRHRVDAPAARLPRADHLARERQVRQRAARILVVQQHRLAEARRLGQPHVARNDRAEHLVAEMLDQLRRDFVREVVPRVEHRAQDALELELRIHRALICSMVLDQRRKPFERVVLALHRDQHAVGRNQRVHREHVQRRRAVDQDDVVTGRAPACSALRSRDSRPGLRHELALRRRPGPGWPAAA